MPNEATKHDMVPARLGYEAEGRGWESNGKHEQSREFGHCDALELLEVDFFVILCNSIAIDVMLVIMGLA